MAPSLFKDSSENTSVSLFIGPGRFLNLGNAFREGQGVFPTDIYSANISVHGDMLYELKQLLQPHVTLIPVGNSIILRQDILIDADIDVIGGNRGKDCSFLGLIVPTYSII